MVEVELGDLVKRLAVGGIAGLALGLCHKRGYAITPKAVEEGIKFGPAVVYGAVDAYRSIPAAVLFGGGAVLPVLNGGVTAAIVGAGTFLGYCVGSTI